MSEVQKHLRWTMEGPHSSYSCLEIHICWKVEREARMEPPIQTEYFLSGGAMILILLVEGAWRETGGQSATNSAHQRNAGTIDAARRLRDAEQNRRREELQRRIEETRMKLQNIGYRTLKGSQSINDLSSFPESSPSNNGTLPRPSREDEVKKKTKKRDQTESSSPNTSIEEAKPEGQGQGTSLKRAYSLSDLNKPNVPRRILPAPPANVSGKKGGNGPTMSSTPTRPVSIQIMKDSDNGGRALTTGVIGEVSMVAAGASMVEAGREAVPNLRVLYCPDLSSMRKCWR